MDIAALIFEMCANGNLLTVNSRKMSWDYLEGLIHVILWINQVLFLHKRSQQLLVNPELGVRMIYIISK